MTGQVNWDVVFNSVSEDFVRDFVSGNYSGRALTSRVSFTEAAGEVRQLLRQRGVSGARRLARKALLRRV